jgi:RNA polymerase-binding transcription factor DksA
MAKSSKKKAAKPAKKVVVKAKSASKAKKAPAAKAKKVAKKAALVNRSAGKAGKIAKKVVAKSSPKKAAPKKANSKKVETKKAEKVKAPLAKKETVKKVVEATLAKNESTRTQTHKPAAGPLKLSPSQLNIFPILTQRPIAHKPAKPSTTPDDKTRYSEEELKEFELLINGKLAKSREEFKILKDTLTRTNDAGTDSTSGGNTKVLEDGAETAEKENLSQLAARQLKYITNLENALVRIKNGTYGICSVTGKLISKERLIAVPHTTQSIEAKMMKQD